MARRIDDQNSSGPSTEVLAALGKGAHGITGLYLKDGVFYFQSKQCNGVRPRAVSLRTKDLTEAILAADTLRQQDLMGAATGQPAGSLRMLDLLPIYLDEKTYTKVFTARSKINAEVMLRGIAEMWDNPAIGMITETKIRKYREFMHQKISRRGKPVSESTISTYLTRLKGFLSWCVERRYIRSSPMARVMLPRVKRTRISEFATIDERNALLSLPCQENIATILHLGFYAGLRYGEMLALRWMDLETRGKETSIKIHAHDWFAPKGKQARIVPVPNVLRLYLHGIKRPNCKSSDYIIAPHLPWLPKHAKSYRYNPKKSFASHAKQAGVAWNITYHHLRHSYATHHISRGTSLALIAQWTGDTEAVISSNYAGYYPDATAVNAIE